MPSQSPRHKAPAKHRSSTQGSISKKVLLPTFAAVTCAGVGVAGVVGGSQLVTGAASGGDDLALSDVSGSALAKHAQATAASGGAENRNTAAKPATQDRTEQAQDEKSELPPPTKPRAPKPENVIASGKESFDRSALQKIRKDREERAARKAADRAAASGDPKAIARSLLSEHGWDDSEFTCLETMWERESSWDPSAENPSSGAYGIAQALPASKMSEFGSDYRTNAKTQIKWGLSYISSRYDSPCGAWSFWQRNNWY